MNTKYLERYNYLLEIIKPIGEVALEYSHNISKLNIKEKSPQNLVSEVDLKIEKLLINKISARFENDNILGEESSFKDENNSKSIWIIDPIDGTLPFLSGLPHWCISIAFLAENQLIFGVVFAPFSGELFHGFLGQGAYLNNQKLLGEKDSLNPGFVALGYTLRVDINQIAQVQKGLFELGVVSYLNGSGALMICYTAASKLNGYIEPHIYSWDMAAGIIIASEAGLKHNIIPDSTWLSEGSSLLVAPQNNYNKLAEIIPWKL